MSDDKPFLCTAPGCGQRFTNEDHLAVHKHKHEMTLKFGPARNDSVIVADQTPTPTRFLKNCEEVGLFNELASPFEHDFRKASDYDIKKMPLDLSPLATPIMRSKIEDHTGMAVHRVSPLPHPESTTNDDKELSLQPTPTIVHPASLHVPNILLATSEANVVTQQALPSPTSSSVITPVPSTNRPVVPASGPFPLLLQLNNGQTMPVAVPASVTSSTSHIPTAGPLVRPVTVVRNVPGIPGPHSPQPVQSEAKLAQKVPLGQPLPQVTNGDAGDVQSSAVSHTAPPPCSPSQVPPLGPALVPPLGPALAPPLGPALVPPLGPALVPPLGPALVPPLGPALVPTLGPALVPPPSPAPVPSPAPLPIQAQAPSPVPVPSPAPVHFQSHAPSPAPVPSPLPVPLQVQLPSPAPVPSPGPVPLQSQAPSPAPVPSPLPLPVQVQVPVLAPSPSPAPLLPPPEEACPQSLQQPATSTTETPASPGAPAQHTLPTGGRRRRATSEDPDEKRRKFLERNRAAASRCRQKRKVWVQSLERKAEDLNSTNGQLQNEVTLLRNEVAQLKQLLLAHKDCPVTALQKKSGYHIAEKEESCEDMSVPSSPQNEAIQHSSVSTSNGLSSAPSASDRSTEEGRPPGGAALSQPSGS